MEENKSKQFLESFSKENEITTTKQFLGHLPSPECSINLTEVDDNYLDATATLIRPQIFAYNQCNVIQSDALVSKPNVLSPPCGSLFHHQNYRRQRSEKKPIPDEQKDDKYYERRKRNNQAAKKSRDARKQREDQIALRATLLEHENALLKAQLLTVREEASSLRQLLLEKKSLEFSSRSEAV